MEAELTRSGEQVEAAAVEGDVEGFVRRLMRQRALPRLIREAKAEPVRRKLAELESEAAAMDEAVRRVREEPYPVVPPGMRGHVTPRMAHDARLQEAVGRQRAIGEELKAHRRLLAQIEAEGVRPLT